MAFQGKRICGHLLSFQVSSVCIAGTPLPFKECKRGVDDNAAESFEYLYCLHRSCNAVITHLHLSVKFIL